MAQRGLIAPPLQTHAELWEWERPKSLALSLASAPADGPVVVAPVSPGLPQVPHEEVPRPPWALGSPVPTDQIRSSKR